MRTMLFQPATGESTVGDETAIERWKASADAILWLDLQDVPAATERRLMTETFGLHPLAIQDAQRERHPPKYEAFKDHVFILMKGLDGESRDLDFGTIQIAMFVGHRFLVTRHSGDSSSTDRVWAEALASPGLIAAGADALAVRLSRFIVDRYLPILLALESRLDELEEEMIARPTDTLLAELVGHKAQLKKLRRLLTYHVRLFDGLRTASVPAIRDGLRHELQDVYEHLERSSSLAALYYELASDLMDGYITMASHRLNQIVKILTIVTTVFVPLSFIAGVYGMNFDYIPELHLPYGYFVALFLMISTAVGALVLMYRKGWIGEPRRR
ncbi:MAG: magnesium/cobalt transporter CorA [Vicinamibacterales bacterium]